MSQDRVWNFLKAKPPKKNCNHDVWEGACDKCKGRMVTAYQLIDIFGYSVGSIHRNLRKLREDKSSGIKYEFIENKATGRDQRRYYYEQKRFKLF